MGTDSSGKARLPPRWFMRLFWAAHRRAYRWSGGRIGLWRATAKRWGAMRVTTIGRRTGREHPVMVGYFEDGDDLVTLAMNGWGEAEPAWWLNVQAHPDVEIDLKGRHVAVTAHAAVGEERERLWARWKQYDGDDLDAFAARRPRETSVVVFTPREAVPS